MEGVKRDLTYFMAFLCLNMDSYKFATNNGMGMGDTHFLDMQWTL